MGNHKRKKNNHIRYVRSYKNRKNVPLPIYKSTSTNISCIRDSKRYLRKQAYIYQTYMNLNALNGSKIRVACDRIRLSK